MEFKILNDSLNDGMLGGYQAEVGWIGTPNKLFPLGIKKKESINGKRMYSVNILCVYFAIFYITFDDEIMVCIL